ncbi:MAG TPA: hypothetical protein P5191_10635 [Ruminococcus sp.]|nr:hypothetical protein [Ruminococcus sp.]
MKNDYEMYKSVLSRRDEYRRKKAGRIRIIKCTVPIVACFSFAVIIGLSHCNSSDKLQYAPASQNMIEEPANTSPVTTTSSQNGYTTVTTYENNANDKVVSTTVAGGDPQSVYTTIMTQSRNENTRITNTASAVTGTVRTVTSTAGESYVVTTTVQHDGAQSIDDERSIIMKKVSLFLAGIMASSAAAIPKTNAEFNYYGRPGLAYDFRLDTYKNEIMIDDYYYKDLEKYFDRISNGEIDVDFNNDGVVDITDCRLLWWADDELDRRKNTYQTDDYKYMSVPEILDSEEVKNLEKDKPDDFLDFLRHRFLLWWCGDEGYTDSYFTYKSSSDSENGTDTSNISLLRWSYHHPEYEHLFKDGKNYDEYRVANLEINPEIMEKLAANGDIVGDGSIDLGDSYILLTYVIDRDGASFDYLCPSYFYPEGITAEELEGMGYWTAESNFCGYYAYCINCLYAGYPVIESLIDSGKMNIDVNANGEIDLYDYLTFNLFNHEIELTFNYEDGFTEIYEEKNTVISDEERARIFEVYRKALPAFSREQLKNYIDAYFASHIELKPEYYEDDYYEALLPGYSEDRVDSDGWVIGDPNCHPGVELETAAGRMGIVTDRYAAFYGVEPDTLKEAFTNYYIAVKEGTMPAPDIDMDGEVSWWEYRKIESYIDANYNKKIPSDEETYGWDMNVWNNIAENCDFSQNGISGDIYDYYCAWFCYELSYHEAYVAEEEAKNESGISAQTFEAGIISDQAYELLRDCDIERSGDLNFNGKLDMGDAVAILHSYSNPDKYELTAVQRFNADLSNTGDGITPNDALEVQRKLLGLS